MDGAPTAVSLKEEEWQINLDRPARQPNWPKPAGRASAADQQTAKASSVIDALKQDHHKAEQPFPEYKSASDAATKARLIRLVCQELIIHTGLEDEIFYPAYRDAGCEDDVMDEAQVEHDSAKMLIADLLDADPDEQFTDAKVAVLAEKIKHHAEEEEPAQGIIAQAQAKAHGRQRCPRPPPDGTTAGTRCRPSAHARRFLQRSGEHDAERSR